MTRGKNPGLPVAPADGQKSEGEEAAAYEVGYGRPPLEHRFQPGRSGNPRGRPKGARNLASVVAATLGERIVVTENDRRKRITKLEAAVKQLVNRAAAGDARSPNLSRTDGRLAKGRDAFCVFRWSWSPLAYDFAHAPPKRRVDRRVWR
jgi:Family of unknown function (DUF5681)